MENARTAGSAGTGHPQPSRPSCHGFVRSRWVRESQRLKLLLQETRASKKAPRSRGLSVSINRNRSLRSEEHTSELQSLMRISYAVFCLKKKNKTTTQRNTALHH